MTWLDADSRVEARRMLQPASEAEYRRRIEDVAPVWIKVPWSKRGVIDLSGRHYGMLTVVGPVRPSRLDVLWQCRCDCGRSTVVLGRYLRDGTTRSCGCNQNGKEVPDGVVQGR